MNEMFRRIGGVNLCRTLSAGHLESWTVFVREHESDPGILGGMRHDVAEFNQRTPKVTICSIGDTLSFNC